jgi:hypothetical protein
MEGARPTCKVPPSLVMVVVGGAGRGKGSFSWCYYLMERLSSLIPVYEILHIVSDFLSGGAHLLAVSSCYLGMFPKQTDVGR